MIHWFGPQSWGAPVCDTTPRCAIPVGVPCLRCHRPIAATDSGITLPHFGLSGDALIDGGRAVFHYACHLKSVVPHWLWPSAQLTPDETDGVVDGAFNCPTCGMGWTAARGWYRRLLDGRPRPEVVADARRLVAEGGTHDCSEWTADGVCVLCGRPV